MKFSKCDCHQILGFNINCIPLSTDGRYTILAGILILKVLTLDLQQKASWFIPLISVGLNSPATSEWTCFVKSFRFSRKFLSYKSPANHPICSLSGRCSGFAKEGLFFTRKPVHKVQSPYWVSRDLSTWSDKRPQATSPKTSCYHRDAPDACTSFHLNV